MANKGKAAILALVLPAVLLAGCEEEVPLAVGQLMSDRLEVTAEAAETIVAIEVAEGQRVAAGETLLRQDDARLAAREREAHAAAGALEALLEEQREGPRAEVIDASRAEVEQVEVELGLARRELERLRSLRERDLGSQESVDRGAARVEAAQAALRAARARLRELEAGTRAERIEQTRQQLEQARARLAQIEIDRERLHYRAPRAARVDALPFEEGERPPAGAVLAVLLTGEQPHARVYVPEALRVGLQPGDAATVYVDGLEAPLQGSIRRIASDPVFTPYFALTEHDRGRLAYVAEIALPAGAERLPDGVPVEAVFGPAERP